LAMCCAINTQLGAIGHSTWVFYLERGNDTLFLGSRTGFMSVDLLWAQSRTIYPFEQITISSDGHHIHQTWQSERGTGNVHATQLSDTQAQVTDYYAAVDDTHESRAAWIVGQYDDTICWAAWQIYLEWRLESRDPDYASIADGLVAGQYGELSEHDQKLVLGLAGDWEATSQALVETVRLLILN